MNYVEDSVAVFTQSASRIFNEHASTFLEKEKLYLKGTSLLRTRVLDGLIQDMRSQMASEIEHLLTNCRRNAPAEFNDLRNQLEDISNSYTAKFRNTEFEAEH